MKTILSILALTVSIALVGGLAGMSQASQITPAQPESSQDAIKARMYAVGFHADWCANCKAMAPNYKELMAQHAKAPILHIKLDLTDDFTKRQAAMMANALGLDETWDEFDDKTGFVLLIDAKTKKVIGKITSDQSTEQMDESLVAAMANLAGNEHPRGDHPEHPAKDHPDHPSGDHPSGDHPSGDHPGSDHPGGG